MRATLNRPPPVAETSRPSARASKRSRRKGTADPIPALQGCKRLRSRHCCAQGYAVLRMQSAEKWGGKRRRFRSANEVPETQVPRLHIPGIAIARYTAAAEAPTARDGLDRGPESEAPSDWSHVARRPPRAGNLLTARAG